MVAAPLAGAPIAASGAATIAYTDGAPLTVDGSFQLKGPGLDGVTLDGHARGGDARGHLSGQIDLAAWPALWSRYFQRVAGTAAVDLTVVPAVGRPRVSGRLRIARDFVLRTPRWPAPITCRPAARSTSTARRSAALGCRSTRRGCTARWRGVPRWTQAASDDQSWRGRWRWRSRCRRSWMPRAFRFGYRGTPPSVGGWWWTPR